MHRDKERVPTNPIGPPPLPLTKDVGGRKEETGRRRALKNRETDKRSKCVDGAVEASDPCLIITTPTQNFD